MGTAALRWGCELRPEIMTGFHVEKLRELKAATKELAESIVDDLAPFIHEKDNHTFVRLPTSKHLNNDVGVTVTCSCLMALSLTGRSSDFAEKRGSAHWDAKKAFKLVVRNRYWRSSGLVKMNAFTSTLVLRAFGFLVEKEQLRTSEVAGYVHIGGMERRVNGKAVPVPGRKTRWTLNEVFRAFASRPPEKLKVEEYSTSSAVVYWFVDAVERSNRINRFDQDFWGQIAAWAAKEFWKQVSLVTAKNDAFMDPVAMAMAACVCKKLKRIAENLNNQNGTGYLQLLPSEPELEFSIKSLFACQAPSGIWPKYFPLFHYPDAGNNFCFTYEMLEAVLNEFGKGEEVRILEIEGALDGLSKALQWCKQNRFEYQKDGRPYRGWNSGGQLKSLSSSMPESWATAVVHMFLWELEDVLSRRIQEHLLEVYKAQRFPRTSTALDEFLDVDILIRRRAKGLKSILERYVLKPALKDDASVRKSGLTGRVSALLFGPPGTSKTEMCKSVAERLGWPLLEIDPSHFLKGGWEAISIQADKIFTDLMDLSCVVVLFDEMDALVQTRDTEDWHLDTTSQLLTTSMLPKLSKLRKARRVIFFMATNFQNRFDPAIKRAGRFDLLLCMGPPTRQSKLDNLKLFLERKHSLRDLQRAAGILESYIEADSEIAQVFDLYTFGDMKAFFGQLETAGSLFATLKALRLAGFKHRLTIENGFNLLRIEDLKHLPPDLRGKTLKQLEADDRVNFEGLKSLLKFPLIRYLVDKKQSKIQA